MRGANSSSQNHQKRGLLVHKEMVLAREPVIAALKQLGLAVDAWLSDPACNQIGADVSSALSRLVPRQLEADCVVLSTLQFPAMDELRNRQQSVRDCAESFQQAVRTSSSNSIWRAVLNLRISVEDYFRWIDTLFNA